jgi:release factor glutamine methyltransferase
MASMQTIREILQLTEEYFARSGLEAPKVEAGWLVAGVLGCARLELFLQADRPLTHEELDRLRPLVKRRAGGEPLQYLLGFADFHELRIPLRAGVLIPRPETEQLVEEVVARCAAIEAPRIIDLGTGSGAIALALAKALPEAKVLAVDASTAALEQARANAEQLGLRQRIAFRRGNWLDGLTVEADVIVANPPYLTEAEWAAASREVRDHEPKAALVAADNGMADLKRIIETAAPRLARGGWLALEMGIRHAAPLTEFAAARGWQRIATGLDVHQRQRFFFAQPPAAS